MYIVHTHNYKNLPIFNLLFFFLYFIKHAVRETITINSITRDALDTLRANTSIDIPVKLPVFFSSSLTLSEYTETESLLEGVVVFVEPV